VVTTRVLGCGEKFQILNAVIGFITVQVVNVLI
jgi:hypothetical protein